MKLSIILLILSIAVPGVAQTGRTPTNSDIENIGSRNINKGKINLLSLEKEVALGRQLAEQFESTVTLVDDPQIRNYIDQIGQRIAGNSDVKVPVSIRVVNSKDVNISALPGGFIYLNTGLLRVADNEAELAFAIAYAVAHVAARHGSEDISRAELLNVATVPQIFVAGPAGMTLKQDSGTIVPVAFYSFVRKAVSEADYLGIQYLYKAGYDPQAAVTLLQKIEAVEIPAAPKSKLFATHPLTADRIQAIEQNIGAILPARMNNVLNTSEFNAIKARLP